MKFKFENTIFTNHESTIVDENNFPPWLTHKDNKWFLDRHVLTLRIGGYVETDFQVITRVE